MDATTEDQNKSENTQAEFEYGWCYTDHKPGKQIRPDFRSIDYMNDEPYASKVKETLEMLGLPKPEAAQIFRGTHHDLLFLNTHGVVVRIGHTDVEDLMNPAIVQPLGWVEDKAKSKEISGKQIPFTVSLYPGIELYSKYLQRSDKPELAGDLDDFLRATNQGTADVSRDNMGIIRILDEQGKELAVPMLLDADNRYNSSSQELSEKRSSKLKQSAETSSHKGDVLSHTLQDVFSAAKHVGLWQRAFQLHQPLRNAFWSAMNSFEDVDEQTQKERMKEFWDKCKSVTNQPTAVVMNNWSSRVNEHGVKVFQKTETRIPNLVLYRPWTGKEEDQTILPADEAKRLKVQLEQERERKGLPPQNKSENVAKEEPHKKPVMPFLRRALQHLN